MTMPINYLKPLFTSLLIAQMGVVAQAQFDGFALYNHLNQSTAYLIDDNGAIAHSWSCPTNAGYALALRDNGNIVRAAINSGNQINGAAVAGRLQELDPSGNVVWDFTYSTANYVTHHDICLMPNGNVLLSAWFKQTTAQLQALGYTGSSAKYPTRIIEVQQNGTGGQVVWEWNMLDHFIQDVDAAKPNYGVIADHPERMDINVPVSGAVGPGGSIDWFHVNGIDYNPALDQIAFSSRYLSELFIIDHSTATSEAATSAGGNAGKGGDFLYRWGNPDNYDNTGTQTIAGAVHDVRWIKNGAPNEGYLQFVNNVGGPGGSTAIDAINPPLSGFNYTKTPGQAYGPTTYDWRHQALTNASGQSASDRMPNGNIFVALSGDYMYEVDTMGTVVWQYNDDPQKAFRYLCADAGIIALLGPNPCGVQSVDEISAENIGVFPNPSEGSVTLTGLYFSDVDHISIMNALGKELFRLPSAQVIDLSSYPVGMYYINIVLESGKVVSKKVSLQY